jgi:N-acetylglucosamine-6-phosphate deacetylase
MTRYIADEIITPAGSVEFGCVDVIGDVVAYVGSLSAAPGEPTDSHAMPPGKRILPGFVDLHVNGGGGRDVLECSAEAMLGIAAGHAKFGTTSLLIAVPGIDDDRCLGAIHAVADAIDTQTQNTYSGARIVGIHMEGPFINPVKAGVIPKEWLKAPSAREFRRYLDASRGSLKVMTMAPELPGSLELIPEIVASGVIASVGHSDATFEQMQMAIGAGISYGSHVFNAMRGFTHTEPGTVGAVLRSPAMFAEIVTDGFHVHPAAVEILWKCVGPNRTCIVTDATEVVGTDLVRFQIAGEWIDVRNGRTWRADGGLAGSVLSMNVGLRNLSAWTGAPLCDTSRAASLTPATAIGIQDTAGSLEPGKRADFVVVGADFDVELTCVGGEVVHRKT